MKIKVFEGGYDKNFSYLIWCNKTKNASIIDPSVKIDSIINEIQTNNLNLDSIFITHSHHDHFAYLNDFLNKYHKINIYINHKSNFNNKYIFYIKNKQKILIGDEEITCLSTPGHFYDSMCFWNKKSKILFTGDTVFVGRTGRVISHKSSIEDLYNSIYNIILKLPMDTTIYPGHNYGFKKNITIQENIHTSKFFKSKNLEEFKKTMSIFEENRLKT